MKKVFKIAFLLISLAFPYLQSNGQNLPVACGGSKVRYGVTGLPESTYDWIIEGGTIDQNYNDSIDVTWDNIQGIHQLTVTEHTVTNCVATPETGLVMISVPQKPELGTDLEICQGQTINISDQTNYNYSTYYWSTGATTSSIKASIQNWYKLQVTDGAGCVATDSVYLTVNNLPQVNLGRDTILCGNIKTISLDAGSDGTDYFWSNSLNNKTWNSENIDVTDAARYFVKVTNAKGCVNSDAILVGKCDVYVPNAFTPNGDGENDNWVILDLESYPDASVEIYDRWGRLVYQTKSGYPSLGWDGTSHGRNLPMDSYFYFIKLNDGSNKTYKGSVTIIR